MDLNLSGHVSLVTGASRGLGEAAVRALVAEGANVLVAARTTEALEALVAELGDAVAAVTCDMTDRVAVAALAEAAVQRFGRLDSVVNNAGIAPGEVFLDQPEELLDEVLAVNLVAPLALSRAAARHWIQTNSPGSIVNVVSTAGIRGKPRLVAYSASKGGLVRATEALAGEWAKHDIRVNSIAPGAFETAAQSAVLADPDLLGARLRRIPMRRMGAPEEMAPLVCYLVSPLSRFVTGSCYVIDGGESAKL